MPLASATTLAAPTVGRRPPPRSSTPTATTIHATVTGVDTSPGAVPFDFILGESINKGWTATVGGGPAWCKPVLIDAFANGWRIDPAAVAQYVHDGQLDVTLTWTPQKSVDWAVLDLHRGHRRLPGAGPVAAASPPEGRPSTEGRDGGRPIDRHGRPVGGRHRDRPGGGPRPTPEGPAPLRFRRSPGVGGDGGGGRRGGRSGGGSHRHAQGRGRGRRGHAPRPAGARACGSSWRSWPSPAWRLPASTWPSTRPS